jgi:hypothetical protein
VADPGRSHDYIIRRTRCAINDRLQTHTWNIYYLLLFHGNNIYANALKCYVHASISLPVLLSCENKRIQFRPIFEYKMCRDISVGIATRYGQFVPGIESRCGQEFRNPFGPA